MRRIIGLLLVIACTLGFLLNYPETAFAAENGVNLSKQCKKQYGEEAFAEHPRGGDVFSWKCVVPPHKILGGVNVQAACSDQYSPNFKAKYHKKKNPYSWYCAKEV